MKIWLKVILCLIISAGCFMLCRVLEIAPLVPVAVTAWGSLCLIFSWELAGSKLRIRNGIEQKTPLQLMWIIAGTVCLLLVGGFLFTRI